MATAVKCRPSWRPQLAQSQMRKFCLRRVSALSTNPHIKAFRLATLPPSYLLSYLDSNPPSSVAAIGTTTELPPTPRSFNENPTFLRILNDVLRQNASLDEGLQAQAAAYAGPGGSLFGTAGMDGGASHQSSSGGGGVGGWVHLSDLRNPPDFGRIAWPEDILGSVEVDKYGHLLDAFQPSGTYRIVTNEGILGLSDFLRGKLIERLKEEEKADTSQRPEVLEIKNFVLEGNK